VGIEAWSKAASEAYLSTLARWGCGRSELQEGSEASQHGWRQPAHAAHQRMRLQPRQPIYRPQLCNPRTSLWGPHACAAASQPQLRQLAHSHIIAARHHHHSIASRTSLWGPHGCRTGQSCEIRQTDTARSQYIRLLPSHLSVGATWVYSGEPATKVMMAHSMAAAGMANPSAQPTFSCGDGNSSDTVRC